MDTDFEDNNEEKSPVDDPSPESLNAQQNTVEQPSNAVKEVGYEDNTNNREIIQDAVAFQMDPVNTSTSGTPANGNEVETIEMVGDGCCGPSSGCCNSYLIYTILVNILAIISAVLSIVAVSTCQFLKIKNDSPWFGLLGWGRHQWDDQCSVDFQDWRCEEYDLEDDFGLAARIFGVIAAVVGFTIAVWTIISIFFFPRWMKVFLTTFSFSNVLFQGLVFLVYGGEVCQEEKLEYCGYNWYYDDYYNQYCSPYIFRKSNFTSDGSRNLQNVPSTSSPSSPPSSIPSKVITSFDPTPISQYSPPSMMPHVMPAPTTAPTATPTFCVNYDIIAYPEYDNGKGCEFSLGAICAVIAMISWLVLGILFIFRKSFSRKEATKNFHNCWSSKCCEPSPSTSLNGLHSSVLNINKVLKEEILSDGTKNSITTYQPDLSEYRMTIEMVYPNGSKVIRNVEERFIPFETTRS